MSHNLLRGLNQGLAIEIKALYLLNHVSSPFCFSCFSDRVLWFFTWVSLEPLSSYLWFPHSWDYKHVSPHLACFLRYSLTFFCLGWPKTGIFLSPPGITGGALQDYSAWPRWKLKHEFCGHVWFSSEKKELF
jgi:hypothetical protein